MKTAFLFPGQGAQVVGMGQDVAEAIPAAAQLYEQANDIAGFDLRKLCFEGPEDQLNTTAISQPAIFVTSAALLQAFKGQESTAGISPDVTAGLSLGEYTALYAAGAISFEDGLRLVLKRGQAMQAAADASEGSMVSVMGLEPDKVEALCAAARQGELLEPANFNCPGQVVISGAKAACERAATLAEEHGAMKAVILQVAGAFHTSMMAPAADELSQALADTQINDPAPIQVMSNVKGDYYGSVDEVRGGLTNQLTGAVLWQACVEKLLADGVECFYEIGPGKVLTGLMRRIHRRANITNVSSFAALEKL